MNFLIILAVAVAPFVTPFRLDSREKVPCDNETLKLDEQLSRNETISLKQFSIFNELGSGGFAHVYVAQKNGGSDDGKLYALKAIEIPNIKKLKRFQHLYNTELKVLKALEGVSFSIGLHYAFREGNWLFLVMDLVTGGSLLDRLHSNDEVDAVTTKLIVAELIVAVERMHKSNIVHLDLGTENILIDNEGHLAVIDFGLSKFRSDDIRVVTYDWVYIPRLYSRLSQHPFDEPLPSDLLNLLENDMTDEQVPELKKHPYFDGIDWERMAAREFQAPFPPNKSEICLEGPKNVTELFKIDLDYDLADQIAEIIPNYSFVALEHQN